MSNRKAPERRGKVQLVDAREYFAKMRKSLGEKRKEISSAQIDEITRLYGDFTVGEKVKIFPNEAFGSMRITVERPLRLRWEVTDETIAAVLAQKRFRRCPRMCRSPSVKCWSPIEVPDSRRNGNWRGSGTGHDWARLGGAAQKAVWTALAVRDESAPIITDRKGNPNPDPDLRDNENVPLPSVTVTFEDDPTERFATPAYRTEVDDYMRDQVLPYVPDAWVDHARTKIAYEIPLTRYFYRYVPPRPLEEIDAEIKTLEGEVQRLLAEITE